MTTSTVAPPRRKGRSQSKPESAKASNTGNIQCAQLVPLKDLDHSQHLIERAKHEWENAVDAVQDPLFLHDHEGRVVRANQAYAERAGLDIGEVIGKPYWQLFPKSDGPQPCCNKRLDHHEVEEEELQLPTGESFLVRYYPVFDAAGNYCHSLHLMQDITERKRSEKQLQLFRHLLDQTSDAIFIVDPATTQFVDVNEAACRNFGYTREELLRLGVLDVQTNFPDAAAWAEHVQEIRAKGQAYIEFEALRKDARRFPVEVNIKSVQVEATEYIVAVVRDITERKQAEAAAQEGRALYQSLVETTDTGYVVLDPQGCVIDANAAYVRLTGHDNLEQICGRSVIEWTAGYEKEKNARAVAQCARDGHIRNLEIDYVDADGHITPIEINATVVMRNGLPQILSLCRDITMRRLADQRLRRSEKELREAQRVARLGSWTLDSKTGAISWTEEIFRVFGLDPQQAAPSYEELRRLLSPDSFARMDAAIANTQKTGVPYRIDLELIRPDGSHQWIDARGEVVHDANGCVVGLRGTALDITERKQIGQALHDREVLLAAMTDSAQDAITMIDERGAVVYWNPAAEKILGYSRQEALGKNLHQWLAPERYRTAYSKAFPRFAQTGEGNVPGKTIELQALRKDGTEFPIELSLSKAQLGNKWHAVGIVRDISERKQTERALQRSLRAQRALSACNSILIHATQERQLLADMCRNIVQQGGYRMAWIGWVEHDAAKQVRPVAHAGHNQGFIKTLAITWADTERGQGPNGRAVRTGQAQFVRDIAQDLSCAPWRAQALRRGYASAIALPLKEDDGEVFGVLDIYAAEVNEFDDAEVQLLQELADDLAFGILTLRTRNERDHYQHEHIRSAALLKDALVGTIRAIALTVEKRDPYTAGHQGRVAQLAAAIAEELGLEADRIEGLKLGAMIHDIGKIYVPAEILNRPGRLSNAEFEMIKSHPEVGYEIIKDVKFPWPVAQMVLQHHERLDGSGYPLGLKGEKIIMEARILAVADAVEAITAHRPYRPALGIEAGLTEIETRRRQYYDPNVVDVCLRLFREKGFTLANSM